MGIAGAPVFAASPVLPEGVARLLGPTGGYLMSYPLAAFVAGSLAERGFDRRYLGAVAAMLGGLSVVFAGGVAWLAAATHIGLRAALASGLYPFLLPDLVKLLAASSIMPVLWRVTRNAR
jgi:biotin transport system substrate-specific component